MEIYYSLPVLAGLLFCSHNSLWFCVSASICLFLCLSAIVKLKENPERFAVAYGATDIDTLNLLLEDYHYLQSNANKKGLYAGFSIFHYIGNYIFSERFKRCPTETIKYEHKSTNPEIGNSLDDLNIGDVVKVNGNEHTILSLHAYDKCNLKADSDKLAIYNMQDSEELIFSNFLILLLIFRLTLNHH